jgi:hypothetical protein
LPGAGRSDISLPASADVFFSMCASFRPRSGTATWWPLFKWPLFNSSVILFDEVVQVNCWSVPASRGDFHGHLLVPRRLPRPARGNPRRAGIMAVVPDSRPARASSSSTTEHPGQAVASSGANSVGDIPAGSRHCNCCWPPVRSSSTHIFPAAVRLLTDKAITRYLHNHHHAPLSGPG